MNNEIKEIYLSDLEWTKTHDNMGGVMCNLIFKDNMSYDNYQKLFKTTYFILCDKDYIINLQEENDDLKIRLENAVADCNLRIQENTEWKLENERLNNIIKIMENYLELIYDLGYDYDGLTEAGDLQDLINELCRYASLGRAYNTTEAIYENNGKKYNILHEELKGE